MTTQYKHPSLREAILEMADDMHSIGIMDDAKYEKITLRHAKAPMITAQPISPDEIKQVRERAHISQAVFARYLYVSTGYISQLERGIKQPTGPALALLNVIRRIGIEAVQ